MALATGAHAYGVLIQDRDSGTAYALHSHCADTLRDVLREAGINPMSRLVDMGPATTSPDEVCNLTTCGLPLGSGQ